MKSNFKVLLAVACLVLASLACQTLMGGGGSNNTPGVPVTQAAQQGKVLLQDDFSSSKWGTGTDSDSSVEYANSTLQMIIYTKNYFVWSTPNASDYQNAHIEVTVTNNNNDPTTAFGIICDQQVTDSSYYFAVTPAGQYAIAMSTVASQSDTILTNGGKWAASELIKEKAPSYRIGADCGNGTLTLYVDGQKVDSVTDATYTNGGVALFVWSGEEVASANVAFDDFLMTELP